MFFIIDDLNINQVIGCSVQKIGVLPFISDRGNVCTATSDKIYCVQRGNKGTIFSGSEVLGPYDQLSDMQNTQTDHYLVNIATDGRK